LPDTASFQPFQTVKPEAAMRTLFNRLLRGPDTRKAAHLTFTVYSRAQCGCCEKALKVLKEARRRYGFSIEEVDIDLDPEVAAKYDTEVPVVTVNGKVRFRGVVNPALLERLLQAECRRADSSEPPED
jgi:glutaredoxin